MRSLNATPLAPLQGCHNDAEHMRNFCLSNNLVHKTNVNWLKDKAATREAFIELMLEYVIPQTYASERGMLISVFTGHGARDRDLRDTNEADGMTEFQVPYDYRENGYWSDSELAALYGMVNPSWRVRLWNDCCHSGDSLRSLGAHLGFSTRRALPNYCRSRHSLEQTFRYMAEPRAPLVKLLSQVQATRALLWRAKTLPQRRTAALRLWAFYEADHFQAAYLHDNIIAAQGCQPAQYSMDAVISGVPQGAFSAAMWLNTPKSPATVTWSKMVQTATAWLKNNGFREQDPMLEAAAPHLLDQPYFS